MKTRHIHHVHHHASISYPVSLFQRLYALIFFPLLSVGILFVIANAFASEITIVSNVTAHDLLIALGYTLLRLLIAYILALVVAVPLALLATHNATFESIFLPLFDILESIPILAFFPVLILVFIRFQFLNGAAVIILFLTMVWSIVFTVVGGLKIIPKDITYAAKVFDLKGSAYFRQIILPAIVPQMVTGSILAVAQGWNIIIVAEVLHTYIPNGNSSQDLFGIGSILVQSAAQGQTGIFIAAIALMVMAIALINFFVWQKLLHYAQKFRFE
jgi:NitT/TauT family transport system permease protein